MERPQGKRSRFNFRTAALEIRDSGFRIDSDLSERAVVSRRSRSRLVVSDYAKLWEQSAHGITPGYIQAKRAEQRAKSKGVSQKARIEQYRSATSRLVRQLQPTQTAIAHAAVKSIYSVDLESTP